MDSCTGKHDVGFRALPDRDLNAAENLTQHLNRQEKKLAIMCQLFYNRLTFTTTEISVASYRFTSKEGIDYTITKRI